jgi:hypothetical protein
MISNESRRILRLVLDIMLELPKRGGLTAVLITCFGEPRHYW